MHRDIDNFPGIENVLDIVADKRRVVCKVGGGWNGFVLVAGLLLVRRNLKRAHNKEGNMNFVAGGFESLGEFRIGYWSVPSAADGGKDGLW